MLACGIDDNTLIDSPMNDRDTQRDWNNLAISFDHWLPHLAPVSQALIAVVGLQADQQLLDVACGTGEPALSFAHEQKAACIVAIDSAAAMIDAAQAKARQQGLSNASFKCMNAENLQFKNNSFDQVISRFGIMLFANPEQGLREIYRVLKPSGQFTCTVWGKSNRMTTLLWAYQTFKDTIPEAAMPPLKLATCLGSNDKLSAILEETGFTHCTVETHTLNYHFDTFDDYWDTLEASQMMEQQLEALPPTKNKQWVREKLISLAKPYITSEGLLIPHEYLLARGYKTR